MKKTQSEKVNTEKPAFINATRRGFIQRSAVVGGVAASGALVADAQAETPLETQTPETSRHAGYQLTDKVKEYYRKARF